MEDCLFCKIVKGEIPSYKIYEDDFSLAFLDISNDANGHILVIPKEHFENVLDCDDNILEKVIIAVKRIANHLKDNCGFSGINIINNSGKDAEQGVFHLHFHIIPRKEDDKMSIFPNLIKNNQTLAEICERLKIN